VVILKFKHASHREVIQIIMIYIFHIVCIRENRKLDRYIRDCETFFVVNHISTKRASYKLSCCLRVAMGGKKVANWIFVGPEGLPPEERLLSGFLQDDRGRMSGHILLLTQRGSHNSFKNRVSMGCLKCVYI